MDLYPSSKCSVIVLFGNMIINLERSCFKTTMIIATIGFKASGNVMGHDLWQQMTCFSLPQKNKICQAGTGYWCHHAHVRWNSRWSCQLHGFANWRHNSTQKKKFCYTMLARIISQAMARHIQESRPVWHASITNIDTP